MNIQVRSVNTASLQYFHYPFSIIMIALKAIIIQQLEYSFIAAHQILHVISEA